MTRIAYPSNPVMAVMWYGAVQFALGEPEILDAFEAECGPWLLRGKRSALDAMIDSATGAEDAAFDAFIDWFNVAFWGEDPFLSGGAP